jgi:hypothetical protein
MQILSSSNSKTIVRMIRIFVGARLELEIVKGYEINEIVIKLLHVYLTTSVYSAF